MGIYMRSHVYSDTHAHVCIEALKQDLLLNLELAVLARLATQLVLTKDSNFSLELQAGYYSHPIFTKVLGIPI